MQKTNKAMEKEMKSKFVNPFEVAKGNVEVLRPKLDKQTKSLIKGYLNILANQISEHYPNSPTITKTVEKELNRVVDKLEKEQKCTL